MTIQSDLHICRWGDTGETIVMIHGSFSSNCEQQFGTQKELADRFILLAPHLRNYGQSPGIAPKRFETEIQDVLTVFGGQKVHLLGYSYGGVVALLTAAAQPEMIRSLTVIEPPAHRDAER